MNARKYPFLADIGKLTYAYTGVELNLLEALDLKPEALDRVKDRLQQVFSKGEVDEGDCDELCEALAYKLELLVLAALKDKWLKQRAAVAEAKRASKFLEREDGSVIASVGKRLGLEVEYLERPLEVKVKEVRGVPLLDVYHFKVGIVSYVNAVKRLLSDPLWKIVNLPVLGGNVFLKKRQVARVLEELIVKKIINDLDGIGEIPKDMLPEKLKAFVENLEKKMVKRVKAKPIVQGGKVPFNPNALPPCIARIYDRALRGENLSHQERFTLATFLLNLGMEVDEVLEVFRNMPDFNERIARYQVEHLAGLRGSRKKYSPPSCRTLLSWGLCYKDDNCKGVHPMKEYFYRLKSLKRSEVKKQISSG